MVVEINTDTLIEFKLTANQFLLAQLIYEGSLGTISSLKLEFGEKVIQEDLDILISAGYLRKSINTYFVTPEFIRTVRKEGMFEELLALYPTSVVRVDGSKDYLRVGIARCKTRYNNIIKKSKAKHDNILKCLQLEIETRTRENSLAYMKRLANWLTSREWEAWEPRLEEAISENNERITSNYGEELE
jgi:hypothetical protein